MPTEYPACSQLGVEGSNLTNALKFTPIGGKIIIRPATQEESIEIHVIDNGPGVPLAERPRLFTEFANISNKPTAGESSTGLGLWIVKKLAHAQQGDAGAHFPESGGSDFWVRWKKPNA